jgi:predicted nucleic acid-binding protein
MLIESDMFIAYMKKEDWLKDTAMRLFTAIEEGRLSEVQASSEVLHEIYYVFSDYAPLEIIKGNMAKIATYENINYIDATREIYLSAFDLMNHYGLTSVFDAIFAATALTDKVQDKTIISTDKIYDKIKGIRRLDPRKMSF